MTGTNQESAFDYSVFSELLVFKIFFSASVTSVSTTGTGLFSQPSTGITSTSTVGSLGLGGTGNFSLGGTSVAGSATGNSVGVTGLAASGNPMEGEVPKQVMDLVTQLKFVFR